MNSDKYQNIADTIIQLKNVDIKLRYKLIKRGDLGKGYNDEMQELHNRNADVLNEIIDQIGYPTIEKVGEEANAAAWLVIQHSIGQPRFMKKCVTLLGEIGDEDKGSAIQLAYLTDRIAVYENKAQLYGTQFDWDENGELSPYCFDDLIKVNQRRNAIGFNTLEEQTVIIRRDAKKENQTPPIDFDKRKVEINAWKKSVGWIL